MKEAGATSDQSETWRRADIRAADFTKEDKTGILEKYKELKHRIQTESRTEREQRCECVRGKALHI